MDALVSHDTVHRVLRCGLTGKVPRWESLAEIVRVLGGDLNRVRDLWTRAVVEAEQQQGMEESRDTPAPADAGTARPANMASPMPRAALDPLLKAGTRRRFRAGETLIRQGDPPMFVAVILSGYVKKIRISPTGSSALHDVLGSGRICGHEVVLSGDAGSAFGVQATTEVTCTALSAARFRELMNESPPVATAVAADLARQLEHHVRRMPNIDDAPTSRVVSALLALALSAGTPGPGPSVEIDISLGQNEIASLAFISREAFARVLRDLRARGLVRTARRRLIIPDLAALAALVSPAAVSS